ncbi:M50 family metallopeptidase [Leucobacter salsicius]|uniref:M50 family metallopeptidase n=1 Tax=Leucobacter salsicius TaxID=664638 RepID=UPI000360206B|nr:M50 family metallopeptidase [Leucobacter salsicius]
MTVATIIAFIFAAAVAITALIFNDRLRQIPETVETIFHEAGHTLMGVAFMQSLPLRTTFFSKAEAQVSSLTFSESRGVTYLMPAYGGYLFPVLVGPALLLFSLTPTIQVPFLLLVLIALYGLMAVMLHFFYAVRVIITLAFHIGVVLLLLAPPELMQNHGSVAGVQAGAAIIGAVFVCLVLGAWTHLFTIWRKDSLRTLAVLIISAALIAALFLFPTATAPVLFGLGIFLTLSGWKTIFVHNHHGGDFGIIEEDLGGSSRGWFVLFCAVALPISLAATARLLWVLALT